MLYLPFAQAPQARVHFSIVQAPGRSVGLLIGVSATDPATYGAVRAVMGVTLLAASSVPARRAAAADPAAVLRAQ